jgi:hypothetical protein
VLLIIIQLQQVQLLVLLIPINQQIAIQLEQLLMFVVTVKPDFIKPPPILAQLVDLDVVHAQLLIHAQDA